MAEDPRVFKAHGTCGQLLLANFWVPECYSHQKSAAEIRTAQLVTNTSTLDAQPAGYGSTQAETRLGRLTEFMSLVGQGASQV